MLNKCAAYGGEIISSSEKPIPKVADFRFLHKYCFPSNSMKRLLLIASLSILALAANAADKTPKGEWIVLVGGPSLKQWEQYKAQPHDHWWANFIRAARLRSEQLREGLGPDAPITWLVYKQGYLDRQPQENQDRKNSRSLMPG